MVIIAVVCFYGITGLFRGYTLVSFSLLSWFLAIWIALVYCDDGSKILANKITDPALRVATAFSLLFLATVITSALMRLLLGEVLLPHPPSLAGRLAGMVLGLAQGLIAVDILVLLVLLTALPEAPWWAQSKLLPPFQATAVLIYKYFPTELAKFARFQ